MKSLSIFTLIACSLSLVISSIQAATPGAKLNPGTGTTGTTKISKDLLVRKDKQKVKDKIVGSQEAIINRIAWLRSLANSQRSGTSSISADELKSMAESIKADIASYRENLNGYVSDGNLSSIEKDNENRDYDRLQTQLNDLRIVDAAALPPK